MKEYQKPEMEIIRYCDDVLSISANTVNGVYNYEINDHKSWNNDNII